MGARLRPADRKALKADVMRLRGHKTGRLSEPEGTGENGEGTEDVQAG